MKLLVKLSALCSIVYALTLTSCNQGHSLEEKSSITSARSSDSACNPENSSGLLHNEGVQYVYSFKDEFAEVANDDVAFRALVIEKIDEYASTIESEGGSENYDWSYIYELDPQDYMDDLSNSGLNDYEQNLIANYYAESYNYEVITTEGLNAFLENTETMVCDLLEDTNVENSAWVLGHFAVAAHSAQLWTSMTSGSNNGYVTNKKCH